MNLADYKKFAEMQFGKCDEPSCDDCTTCRVHSLIEQVWASGQRSGAHQSTQNKEGLTLWSNDYWGQAEMNELMEYASERGAPPEFVWEVFEQVKLWALANETKKRWLPFVKAWLSRELKKNPPGVKQEGLFGSVTTSPTFSRDRKRANVALSLVGEPEF